jgi:ATP diphosphatase
MESLLPYTQEEVWELLDAILSEDKVHIEEELGDVLFQVLFYAKIAEEEGWSDFDKIATKMSEKLIRRHPHVFADEVWGDDIDRLKQWENIKRQEKKQLSATIEHKILDDIPANLPPLLKSKKLQKRAASVGFDWPDISLVFAKLNEELEELRDAIKEQDGDHIEEEFGDLMFVMVNLGRHLKLDPGVALEKCNRKFSSRFGFVEQNLLQQNRSFEDATLEEMETLWQMAKKQKNSIK